MASRIKIALGANRVLPLLVLGFERTCLVELLQVLYFGNM